MGRSLILCIMVTTVQVSIIWGTAMWELACLMLLMAVMVEIVPIPLTFMEMEQLLVVTLYPRVANDDGVWRLE